MSLYRLTAFQSNPRSYFAPRVAFVTYIEAANHNEAKSIAQAMVAKYPEIDHGYSLYQH